MVSVESTGAQLIRFGVQVRVGEDRFLVGFLTQEQAPKLTPPTPRQASPSWIDLGRIPGLVPILPLQHVTNSVYGHLHTILLHVVSTITLPPPIIA